MSDDRNLDHFEECRDHLPGRWGPSGHTSTIVPLPAEVDIANADGVRRDLVQAIDHRYRVVIADMSRTSFCDCAGVSALLAVGGVAVRAHAELRIVARARGVLRTFELTGLHLALPVYATSCDALGEVGGANGPLAVSRLVRRLSRRQQTDCAEPVPRLDQPQCP